MRDALAIPWLGDVLQRPWRADQDVRYSPLAVGWFVALMAGVFAIAPTPSLEAFTNPMVWVLCALCIFGESVEIQIGEATITRSEIFHLVSIAVLASSDAFTVLLTVAVVVGFARPHSWVRGMRDAISIVTVQAGGLVAVMVFRDQWNLDAALAAPTAVLLAAAVNRLTDYSVTLISFKAALGKDFSIREYLKNWVGHHNVSSVLEVPMAVLGACAYSVLPITVVLLNAPYVLMWYTARQAGRLSEAQRQLGTDALTGICNRARFMELAEEEFQHAVRYGHAVALLMGDLDNFKRLNDTNGHVVGDTVLRNAANALHETINGERGVVARYGGEEFVALLPATDVGTAYARAEEARLAVEQALLEWGTTISLGLAFYEPGESIEQLIDRADTALYGSKHSGKNAVSVAESSPSNLAFLPKRSPVTPTVDSDAATGENPAA